MSTDARKDPAAAPERPARGLRVKKGLLVVNTGEGRGKTAAAVGVLLRAWGRKMPARMFQFVKSPDRPSGDRVALIRMGVPVSAGGDGCTLGREDTTNARFLARREWERARAAVLSQPEGVVALDELTIPLSRGWLDVHEVLRTLQARPHMLHVVITGRGAPEELIEHADLVTEMRAVKHHYRDQGISAQPGVEY